MFEDVLLLTLSKIPFPASAGQLVLLREDFDSASFLGQFSARPTPKCFSQLARCLRYLYKNPSLGLRFPRSTNSSNPSVVGYTDADWAGPHTNDRKSQSSYVSTYNGIPVNWRSAEQDCVSLSTNEAEYVALSDGVREAVRIHRLLSDLNLRNDQPIPIRVDNRGATELVYVQGQSRRSKHIDLRYHYSPDIVNRGLITVNYLPSDQMLADGLTKPLHAPKFQRFVNMLGML